MININREIMRLVQYALKHGLIKEEDVNYSINRILAVLDLNEFEKTEVEDEDLPYAAPILENMLDWAWENKRLEENTVTYRDLLDTEIMASFLPRPSEVINTFYKIHETDKKAASDFYYSFSRLTNYVRDDRIEKDIEWTTPTKYGDIVLTINLSKPEKDPKAIAAALTMPSSNYPKCLLCPENEGYKGTVAHPARGNHRIIPLTIHNEKWYMQYSPYRYYNEHCILLNSQHVPMKVSRITFCRLLDFLDFLPHYFIGSNADLPIVGGSILSHDHYQGGNYEFPMAKAGIYKEIKFEGFDGVEGGLVDWAMSVIRLRCAEKAPIIDLAEKIFYKWKRYSDESVDILCETDGIPHNTITPIARMRDGKYELDLVLRNNRTSERYPDGIFHPHPQYHHIKKENIGLIEVMGLAVLPARLKDEISVLRYYLLHPERGEELRENDSMAKHLRWFEQLRKMDINRDNVDEVLHNEIGKIFAKILENAGVYKTDEQGRAAFDRFIDYVNMPEQETL